jgi:hypothetical protein
MKFLFTVICTLSLLLSAIAQSNEKSVKGLITKAQSKQNNEVKQDVTAALDTTQAGSVKEENIVLNETEFNFGKIPQGKPVTHVFTFTNVGKTPISLDNVQASCGCTTPEWSKDAVAPGESSKITVGYNAANEGAFTKSITVTYDGNQTKQINIKGEVWQTPEASAPENSALGTLNNQ